MRKDKMWLRQRLVLVCLVLTLSLQGCGSGQAKTDTAGLRVNGALDMLPLVQAVQQQFSQSNGLALEPQPSTGSIQDLKAGRADVAILGREPSPAELAGLQATVIAYDGVCIITDSRTYAGGLQETTNNRPMSKYEGLQNLSLDDLHGHISNMLRISTTAWHLHGTNSGYYTYQQDVDDNGNPFVDPENPGQVVGTWVWNDVTLYTEALQPGKFDTQEALFQKLGFQDSDLANPKISFVPAILGSEEELISHRFKIDPQLEKTNSTYPFYFFLSIASLRITEKAIQHGFALRALSIDGIDPTSDPRVIYGGSYPLSRKIYLITRQPASPQVTALLKYILSPAGQQLIQQADYLPLPPA